MEFKKMEFKKMEFKKMEFKKIIFFIVSFFSCVIIYFYNFYQTFKKEHFELLKNLELQEKSLLEQLKVNGKLLYLEQEKVSNLLLELSEFTPVLNNTPWYLGITKILGVFLISSFLFSVYRTGPTGSELFQGNYNFFDHFREALGISGNILTIRGHDFCGNDLLVKVTSDMEGQGVISLFFGVNSIPLNLGKLFRNKQELACLIDDFNKQKLVITDLTKANYSLSEVSLESLTLLEKFKIDLLAAENVILFLSAEKNLLEAKLQFIITSHPDFWSEMGLKFVEKFT
jgi:hypothetical protein